MRLFKHLRLAPIFISGLAASLSLPALAQDDQAVSAEIAEPVEAIEVIETDATVPSPAPVVQDYEPNPAIWKLADDDTTIYLFGTFHVLPEGFRWRTEKFDQIVSDADELIVEMADDESVDSTAAMAMEFLLSANDREPISQRLPENTREKWFKLLSFATGASPESNEIKLADRLPTVLALLLIGFVQLEAEGSSGEFGVETILEAEFAAAKKPIGSIENSDEVMRAMFALDDSELIADLGKELAAWDGESIESLSGAVKDFLEGVETAETQEVPPEDVPSDKYDPFEMEHKWARGILDEIDQDIFGEGPFYAAMYDLLLTQRNRDWTLWLEKRLDEPGNILVAVGAGHFEGPDSVLVMLEERDLNAVRVQ